MKELSQLRDSLDNLDLALISILAERFKITDRVGCLKKEHQLAPVDQQREKEQFERIRELAVSCGLAPRIAEKVLRLIIDEVVKRHKEIRENDR